MLKQKRYNRMDDKMHKPDDEFPSLMKGAKHLAAGNFYVQLITHAMSKLRTFSVLGNIIRNQFQIIPCNIGDLRLLLNCVHPTRKRGQRL